MNLGFNVHFGLAGDGTSRYFYCLFRLLWECVFPDFVSKIYDFATPCNLIKATISAAAGQKSTQLHQQQLLQASCTSSSCAVAAGWLTIL